VAVSVRIIQGDARGVLPTLDADSIDAVVTDPPYELGFMGKDWDASGITNDPAFWRDVLRVAKPGAHLVAFGGTRTHHRLMVALEDAGWEIRDCLMWLYGSGYPKSRNVGKDIDRLAPESAQWSGWGTSLKPAYEPIVLARKRISEGNVAANVLRWGTGAINVDGCRITVTDSAYTRSCSDDRGHGNNRTRQSTFTMTAGRAAAGRWPANVILDEDAALLLDAQTGTLKSGANPSRRSAPKTTTVYGEFKGEGTCIPARGADSGGASRFFYVAKASRAERDAGLADLPDLPLFWSSGTQNPGSFQSSGTKRSAKNHHPTIKPLAVMHWLVMLVTPPGGVVLDPLAGSGTTGVACQHLGVNSVLIERVAEYVAIAEARVAHARARMGTAA
jgi:site-specific DNA-methyltransferase (adenine-specific)